MEKEWWLIAVKGPAGYPAILACYGDTNTFCSDIGNYPRLSAESLLITPSSAQYSVYIIII